MNETEAKAIEAAADADERWERSLEGKDQWLMRPLQPPGLLRSGEALAADLSAQQLESSRPGSTGACATPSRPAC